MRVTKLLRELLGLCHLVVISGWQLESGDRPKLVVAVRIRARRRARCGRCAKVAPAWTANLLARPQAEIEVGPERLPVNAELADEAAWERLWPRFVDVFPGYANYLGRTGGRTPRMFVLRPVR